MAKARNPGYSLFPDQIDGIEKVRVQVARQTGLMLNSSETTRKLIDYALAAFDRDGVSIITEQDQLPEPA